MPDLDDPKSIYAATLEALREREAEFEEIVSEIRSLASVLPYWDRILLPEEINQENPLRDFGHSQGLPVDSDKWPTYEKFHDALLLWRAARREAEAAFEDVSEGVEPLPDLPSRRVEQRSRSYHGVPRAKKRPRKRSTTRPTPHR